MKTRFILSAVVLVCLGCGESKHREYRAGAVNAGTLSPRMPTRRPDVSKAWVTFPAQPPPPDDPFEVPTHEILITVQGGTVSVSVDGKPCEAKGPK